jgi:putative transposase
VPKTAQPWVATLVRTIFDQPDGDAVRAQFDQVVATIEAKFPAAAEHLDDACVDLLASTTFPCEIWRQILVHRSAGTAEQGDPPPHRRRRHVPQPGGDHPPRWRRAGRTDRRMDRIPRYMGLELLTKAQVAVIDGDQPGEDSASFGLLVRSLTSKNAVKSLRF